MNELSVGNMPRLTHRSQETNRIEVTADQVQRYSLFLNEQLIDFSKPLTVVTNGRLSFSSDRVHRRSKSCYDKRGYDKIPATALSPSI